MPIWSRSWDDREAIDNINAAEAELDDATLVAAAREDAAAFTQLYRRYFRAIYRYCYIRLGSHEAAEDATSDTFLKALAAIGKYRNEGFAGWLFRIAHNTVVDAQRRQRPQVPFEQAGELIDDAPSPEDVSLARADYDDLHATLALLPDAQRTVMELQLAGLNSEQIGAAIGKGAGTVRMMRFRAFNRLRELIKGRSAATREVSDGKLPATASRATGAILRRAGTEPASPTPCRTRCRVRHPGAAALPAGGQRRAIQHLRLATGAAPCRRPHLAI